MRPLAIVGRACVLPDAASPAALWDVVERGRDVVTAVPAGRFRVDPALVAGPPPPHARPDRTWSSRGGYVRDVAPVGEAGLDVEALGGRGALDGLDPLFHWVLRTGRDCLVDAGFDVPLRGVRAQAVLGNLSFPTEAMTLLGEQQLLDALDPSVRRRAGGPWAGDVDARNRFMSGLPAHLLARALRLTGGAYALDAACASSLYALRLAALALDDGLADVVLAGAVNRADALFLHVGFCALQALSAGGTARPFDRKADGLVPAEGCGFVALMRLDDALAQGRRIHGVVRGVGLSNDGRSKNLLAPSSEGQVRAIKAAWEAAGLSSSTADYVECHATGTPMGDRTEVMSVVEALRTSTRAGALPLGSLKGNLGHLITAAGVAGLIKVTEAFAHETLPASIHADEPLDLLDGSRGVRVQRESAPWPATKDRPRRAGVSAFGFGGNNAHVVVEEHRPERAFAAVGLELGPARRDEPARAAPEALVVVAVGVRLGAVRDLAGLARALDGAEPGSGSVDVALDGVRFPPNDLSASTAQQLLVFEAARDAARDVDALLATADERARTGVFIGMGTDVRITSPGLRWRAAAIAERLDVDDGAFVAAVRDAATGPLAAQHILGCMPNIPANRLNVQLDVRGPGFTVSAEEHSGLAALDVARALIGAGEIDLAFVGAVDACSDFRHGRALDALGALGVHDTRERRDVDGAVVLVVVPEARARAAGLPVLARLDADPAEAAPASAALDASSVRARLGDTHAASGLFTVAAAIARASTCATPEGAPWLRPAAERRIEVSVDALGAGPRRVVVTAGGSVPAGLAPALFVVDASDRAALIEALRRGEGGARRETDGRARRWRAALVDADPANLADKRARLAELLAGGAARVDDESGGMWAREAPAAARDDVALLFGTAGLVAPGAGLEIARAVPDLAAALAVEPAALEAVLAGTRHPSGCLGDLAMATAAMQLSARALVDVVGVRARHTLGVSLGESNALFASGAWSDLGAMLADMERSRLFDEILFASFSAARSYWESAGRPDLCRDPWRAVSVRAPVERVRAACDVDGVRGFCFVLVIHTDDEVEIGGAPFAVEEVVRALGAAAAPMPHMPAVHCPLLEPAAAAYRAIHRRSTNAVDVRAHSHGAAAPLAFTDDAVADAILAQARGAVDVPSRVRRLLAEGVRVLVDVSPRGLAGSWAARIAAATPGAALDVVTVDGTVASLTTAAARLFVAGVDVDVARLHSLAPRPRPARVVGVATERPLRALPPAPAPVDVMRAPPPLPPVTPRPEPRGAVDEPAAAGEAAESGGGGESTPAGVDVVLAHRAGALAAHRGLLEAMSAGHRAFLAHREAHVARLLALGGVDERDVVAGEVLGDVEGPREAPALWSRADLETLASGRIADVWGETFAVQDHFRRQVRMPEPPLLLADRVVSIDARPGVLEKNTSIVTETDLSSSLWYMHENRCPAGILIETGQADLLLVSYMGVDFENRGERVYRLLGCDLTYKAPLPLAGTTLRHDIHVDGFAKHGDTRIFFFHSDTFGVNETLKPVLSVREGQAGFFTDDELAKSGGILWTPADVEPASLATLPLAEPPRPTTKQALDREDLVAFSEGRIADCFGDGFAAAKTHVRTPKIPGGDLLLLDRVTDIDLDGGPWKRGYLRAEYDLSPELWFFRGHFKDDPCMPGTVMFEGCLETLAIYLGACGFTLDKDGHRFEPAVDKVFRLRCRGQAIPSSRKLVYEVFVRSLVDGPEPAVVADILVTVDGLKALHCDSVELKLAVDWPLSSRTSFPTADGVAPATTHALLATAIGKPSDAFPRLHERFDGGLRAPRLPGPPYHFMTRVVDDGGPFRGALARGEPAAGATVVVEYDVPPDAWYFAPHETMPFAVLLEVALQPCGWVSTAVGSALTSDDEVFYRNLDGRSRIHRAVTRDAGTLVTRVKLMKSASSGGMIIQEHEVAVTTKAGEPVFDAVTAFGFFPADALARQVGVPTTDAERARLAERCAGFAPVDVEEPGRLRMIDRITGLWPASSTSKARVRGEKRVDPGDWFFRAHFFQDPVQPGSLGLEAMAQALVWLGMRDDRVRAMARPRVESLAPGSDLVWKYRGQVRPDNALVEVEVELADVVDDGRGVTLVGDGALWVDGTRIYLAHGVAVRIVDG